MSNAKQEILERIRSAGAQLALERPILRRYRQTGRLDKEARLHLLIDRLNDYGATVYLCSEGDIHEKIEEALTNRQKCSILIPPNLPAQWLPAVFHFIIDHNLSYEQIDRGEGVLTGCALAIASTGTIVLRHSAGEGRRALTLIPDYHLCVVHSSQVVETVPEGIQQMMLFAEHPITTVSGPSATSDIEMTRIKGVHGPRTLDVILVS